MAGTPLLAVSTSWGVVVLTVYCLLIAAASFAGGVAPVLLRMSHRQLQVLISTVAGLMLGVGLFHMLPHAIAEVGNVDTAVWWMMMGVLLMFFMLRAFHFHQHGGPAQADLNAGHGHVHDHDHDHGHGHDHAHRPQSLSWLGIAFGLTVHTLIDGVALATKVHVDARESTGWLLGISTFLAILLHKPLDAASITSLMTAGNWPAAQRMAINAGFALMVPLGALSFYFGVAFLGPHEHQVVGCALAFSAGVFLCISLGDLLPEIEFHTHDRLLLSTALVFGVLVAWLIGFLEPAHTHLPPRGPSPLRNFQQVYFLGAKSAEFPRDILACVS